MHEAHAEEGEERGRQDGQELRSEVPGQVGQGRARDRSRRREARREARREGRPPARQADPAGAAHAGTTRSGSAQVDPLDAERSLKFWDSSALVPLVIEERTSRRCRDLVRADPKVVVWQFTATEIISALTKREREDPSFDDA